MDKVDTSSSSSKPAVAQSWDKTFYEEDEKRVISNYKPNPALNVTDQERSNLKLLRRWHDFFEESLPNLKNAIERRFLDEEIFYHKYGMSPKKALCTVDPTRSFNEKVKMYDRIRLLSRKSKTDLLKGYPLYDDLVAIVINESTFAFNTLSRLHEALTRNESLDFGAGKELVLAFEKAAEALDHWHKLLKRGIFTWSKKFTLEFVSEQFNYFQNCQVLLDISSNNDVGTLDKQEKIAEHLTAADLNRRSIKSAKLCELNSFKTSKQKFKKLEPKIRKLIGKLSRKEQRSASKAFGASGCSKKTSHTSTPVVSQKAKVVNEVKENLKTVTETPKTDGKAPESVLSSTENKTEETENVASNIKNNNNNNNIKTESPKPNNDLPEAAASQNSEEKKSLEMEIEVEPVVAIETKASNAPLEHKDSSKSSKTVKFLNEVEEIPSPLQKSTNATVANKKDKKDEKKGEILETEKKEKEKDSEKRSDLENGSEIRLSRTDSEESRVRKMTKENTEKNKQRPSVAKKDSSRNNIKGEITIIPEEVEGEDKNNVIDDPFELSQRNKVFVRKIEGDNSGLKRNLSNNSNTRLQSSLDSLMTLSSNAFETYGDVKNYAVDIARKFIGWLLNADIVPRGENNDRRKSNSVQQEEVEVVVEPEEPTSEKDKHDIDKKNKEKSTEMTEERKKMKEAEVKQKEPREGQKVSEEKSGENLIHKM